jgi:3-phenylpropionate/trans-cinnamate dioxygenase ferredoxin reductase subunit
MDVTDLLVVGSGPAGISAALAYREARGGAVTVLSDDPDLPYERPPLSKDFLRGETEESDVLLHDATVYPDQDIDLRLATHAVALDATARTVSVGSGAVIGFQQCVLATGAQPRRLPVPGADDPAVLILRSLRHGRVLRAAASGARTVAVIGSGFIGCEAAASLARRGLAVILLTDEPKPQAARLGDEVAHRIGRWLSEEGVEVRAGVQVTGVEDAKQVHADGDERATVVDVVLMAAGVQPRSELAESAGLEIFEGRICADRHLRTSSAAVFVAGDAAYAMHGRAGRRLKVEHWGDGLTMGEIAGRNAAGGNESWSEVPGFWTTIGDHTLKYSAWGDGFDEVRLIEHGAGRFTTWYGQRGVVVGVLTHDADDDYERGRALIADGRAIAEV